MRRDGLVRPRSGAPRRVCSAGALRHVLRWRHARTRKHRHNHTRKMHTYIRTHTHARTRPCTVRFHAPASSSLFAFCSPRSELRRHELFLPPFPLHALLCHWPCSPRPHLQLTPTAALARFPALPASGVDTAWTQAHAILFATPMRVTGSTPRGCLSLLWPAPTPYRPTLTVNPTHKAFDVLVDCFFLTDMLVNFRLGFAVESQHGQPAFVCMDPKRIATNYLAFWVSCFYAWTRMCMPNKRTSDLELCDALL